MRDQGKSGRGGAGGYDWGRIVNIVSSAGLYGNPGQAADASANAGQFGLTRVAAMDLAPAQITVNAVAPFSRTRATDIMQPRGAEMLQGARAQDRCAPCRQPRGSTPAQDLFRKLSDKFTDLTTHLEAFNTEPLL